jgi:hypothetical protein
MRVPAMKKVIDETCNSDGEKKLFRAVMRQMSPSWEEVWAYPMDYRDAGAGVGGFIYYSETEPFAKRNLVEILQALNDLEDDLGEPLKKDRDNPLNWYAWFALEHIIDKVVRFKEEFEEA